MEAEDTTKKSIPKEKPNWQMIEDYAYLKQGTPAQFAWEFLRRNKDYQNDFKKYQDYPSKKDLKLNPANQSDKEFLWKYFECDPPNHEGESYIDYENRLKKEGCMPRSGKIVVKNKRNAFFKKYDLRPNVNISKYNPKKQNAPRFFFLNERYPIFTKYSESGEQIPFREQFKDQMIVKFCFLASIDDQLKVVKEEMTKRAKKMGLHIPNKKSLPQRTINHYISCLRVLDAIEADAKDQDMLFHIYKSKFPNPPSIMTIDQLEAVLKTLDPEAKRLIKKNLDDDKIDAANYCKGGYVSIVRSLSYHLNNSKRGRKAAITKKI